jgi:arabinan endo-1,5-alpha-L-arabinosidase
MLLEKSLIEFRHLVIIVTVASCIFISSCKKNPATTPPANPPGYTTVIPPAAFDINSITDTYPDVAPFAYYQKWASYNVHDPSIKKMGDYYYCYSTDVAYGTAVPPGIQIRKSKDLVQWQFVGWVFIGLPDKASQYITSSGGTPNNALWAPYIIKVGSQLRLYYSLSSATCKLSAIGLATATNPEGPWTDQGLVVVSNCGVAMTNAIDPTVVITPLGDQWMYYGSAYDGIYIVKLNPATGFTLNAGDVGKRIANRGFTNGNYNGNIEGAEVIYNPQLSKYFLFISYDWLETKYNVRVAKGDNPDGPFYDYFGQDVNSNVDHTPMIIAPYQFNGHGGWQGTAHCTVFDDGDNHYFIAHQGRPGVNKYYMDLHVRKLFWTTDGWPVASPERYAWESDSTVVQTALIGDWEKIDLGYQVVPGYQNEQVSPDFQTSVTLTISSDGTFNNISVNKWTYTAPWLTLNWNGTRTDKLFVQAGRDWENKKNTIIFSGLNNSGTAVWGKKK